MLILIFTFLAAFICWMSPLQAMTYDNRHFPLFDKPLMHHEDMRFFLRGQPMLMVARSSIGDADDGDDEVQNGLFDITGRYDQVEMNSALLRAGKISSSILTPDLIARGKRGIPWVMGGSFDGVGMALRWFYDFDEHWEIGGSTFFMGVRSHLEMDLTAAAAQNFSPSQRQELYTDNEKMRKANDLRTFFWNKFGMGDFDFYVRLGTLKYYRARMRTIDAGVRLGIIAPTGVRADINNPASLPFGGNGHWGAYIDGMVNLELKEDLFLGMDIRLIKRMPKTERVRMPLTGTVIDKDEILPPVPNTFGVIMGSARINPGVTVVVAPFINFAGLRGGFGAQVGYTLVKHNEDRYTNLLANGEFTIPVGVLRDRSEWMSEYISCSVHYDSAHNKEVRGAWPLIAFDVDIPLNVFASRRSNKTYGISLRIESDLW